MLHYLSVVYITWWPLWYHVVHMYGTMQCKCVVPCSTYSILGVPCMSDVPHSTYCVGTVLLGRYDIIPYQTISYHMDPLRVSGVLGGACVGEGVS